MGRSGVGGGRALGIGCGGSGDSGVQVGVLLRWSF